MNSEMAYSIPCSTSTESSKAKARFCCLKQPFLFKFLRHHKYQKPLCSERIAASGRRDLWVQSTVRCLLVSYSLVLLGALRQTTKKNCL